MEVYDAIKKRRSIWKFQNKEISKEIIEKLSEALVWAPSAGNPQSRKFYFRLYPAAKPRDIKNNKIKSILELPDNLRPIAIVPVGYPGEFPEPPSRLPSEKAINIV